jgi:hypothetical protein
MEPSEASGGDAFQLTDEHRMLLRMRETLYEGSWDDFVEDLRARAEDQPHVFETVPTSPEMRTTIASHLAMIEAMREWEERHARTLKADDAT